MVLAVAGATAMTVCLGAKREAPPGPDRMIDLLTDPHFRKGCKVLAIKPGTGSAKTNDIMNGESIAGIIRPPWATGHPAWDAAQWYSHFNLAAAKAERLPPGSIRFFDGAKAVTFGRPGSPEADIILALNGWKEWGGAAPKTVGAWPNLIMAQELLDNPDLTRYRSARIRISYRLRLHAEADRGPSWNDGHHSAQFVLFLTVQNFNRKSAGFGDYLWFGVPMYDARYRLPIRNLMRDSGNAHKRGTGKFIFNPGGAVYSKEPAIDGHWITINHDVLPLLHEALEAAWSAGFLPDSHKVDDYHLGGITINWEVTGPWNVAMQVRDLGLEPVVAIAG